MTSPAVTDNEMSGTLRSRARFAATIVLAASCLMTGAADAQQTTSGLERFAQGDYAGAIPDLEREAAVAPQDTDTLFILGVAYQREGHHAEAAGVLRRILALDPNYADAMLPLGIAYFHMGLSQLAEETLQRRVDSAPLDASAWMFLGLAQRERGKFDAAIASFERAASTDPELRQSALLNIGVIQREQGDEQAGTRSLREAVAADPTSEVGASAADLLDERVAGDGVDREWSLSLSAGLEYDDNVTTSETDVTSGEQDVASVFDFSVAYRPLKTATAEIELGYDFYQSLYSDLSDFNLQLHSASLTGSVEAGGADVGASYRYTYAELGGDSFFDIHGIRPNVGFSASDKLYVLLSYSYQDKNFDADDDRDASQHGVGVDGYYFLGDGAAYAFGGFRVENENTDGAQFDYLGYYANLGLSGNAAFLPERPTSARVSYQYYLRDYRHTTQSIGKEREDERHTFSLRIRQPLATRIAALLDYQYISADSNLQTSDFTENIATLSLELSF